ncbi:MAG: DUF192 domain-containing protein [Armatimonadetes bacterium]|nr:DUF192 domain-containing protein [Armatimonadota bacterium]
MAETELLAHSYLKRLKAGSLMFCLVALPLLFGRMSGVVAGPERAQAAPRNETLVIGKLTLTVEIASTPESRAKGLMHRKSLPKNHGMLFVFSEEHFPSFWMKNTCIPLSIAFVTKEGRIAAIRDLTPNDEHPVSPDVSVLYALEVNQGVFMQYGIAEGAQVMGLSKVPKAVH